MCPISLTYRNNCFIGLQAT